MDVCKVCAIFAFENLSRVRGFDHISTFATLRHLAADYYFNRPFAHIKRYFVSHNMERFRSYFNYKDCGLAASPFQPLKPRPFQRLGVFYFIVRLSLTRPLGRFDVAKVILKTKFVNRYYLPLTILNYFVFNKCLLLHIILLPLQKE